MKKKLNSSLPASALFYALLMAVIVAGLSTALISAFYFNRMLHEQQSLQKRLIDNVQEGIRLLLSNPDQIVAYGGPLYDITASDSVSLRSMRWGLYSVGNVAAYKTMARDKKIEKRHFLVGYAPDSSLSALYLQDNYKPLALCGDSRITGTARLPKSGVRIGNISGRPYTGQSLVNGAQFISDNGMPGIDTIAVQELIYQWQRGRRVPVSASIPDPINISFGDTTQLIRKRKINLNTTVKGNVLLIADTILIKKDAIIEDACLLGTYIEVESGFEGTLQAIVSQNILIHENVHLLYPSGIALIDGPGRSKEETARIIMKEGSKLEGYLLQSQLKPAKLPESVIGPRCEINGWGHFAGNISFSGSFSGHLFASGFLLKHRGRSYYNHLLDADINARSLSDHFVHSAAFTDKNVEEWKVIKWLD
ncbi:MAG: hypothetical protein MI974_34260 [Chitinophagales bacterium]|nr:hypothetical protein [Chitinophagales bacterium]